MKKNIDLLIINNCPSFYKINLYNEISKQKNIFVIFIGFTDQVVNDINFESNILFPYTIINKIQIEKRNKLKSFFKILKITSNYNYNKIIYGGFAYIELAIMLYLTKKNKNCIQIESSIFESTTVGLKGFIKKTLLRRITIALPSGNLQLALLNELGYKQKYLFTKGVGIFHKNINKKRDKPFNSEKMKYLYVGRLIPIKNVEFLINVFNENGKDLTIVGMGVQESYLKCIAKSNIQFLGFVENIEINKVYLNHDVFILPSLIEPWGLVVEEAINFGLPVIVSKNVGCQNEMVIEKQTGIVFNTTDKKSLLKVISDIEKNYTKYKENVDLFDFEERDKKQIDAYIKILDL